MGWFDAWRAHLQATFPTPEWKLRFISEKTYEDMRLAVHGLCGMLRAFFKRYGRGASARVGNRDPLALQGRVSEGPVGSVDGAAEPSPLLAMGRSSGSAAGKATRPKSPPKVQTKKTSANPVELSFAITRQKGSSVAGFQYASKIASQQTSISHERDDAAPMYRNNSRKPSRRHFNRKGQKSQVNPSQ